MKVTLRFMSLIAGLIFWNLTAWAQPANDDCAGAFVVAYADNEASAVTTDGDSRGATASTEPTSVCSGSWYTDDTWYTFTTPSTLPGNGIVVRVYFNAAVVPTDVPAIGMAIYNSCDIGETPLRCFSSDQPEDNKIELPGACLLPDHQYVVRIWSTGNTAATEGTFRVAAFGNTTAAPFLWYETFAGGFKNHGWTTEGTCAVQDSNGNAGWKYLPDGLVDKGAYIFAGAGINSPTLCDGAVGVDSDYDDNAGIEGNFGAGPCPAPAQHILISPEINSGEWTAVGLSLTWNQALRQFQSTYFISYRVKDGDNDWGDWVDIQVNTEFATNGNFDNSNVQRIFMPGAAGHDFIQIRFVYNANYYMWAIDDVKIVETEANNLRCQTNFFAIPPWATIPSNQVYGWWGENDIYNAGAAAQTNVVLNHTIMDVGTSAEVYNEDLSYGSIAPDFLAENKIFPQTVNMPTAPASYQGTYMVTQDQADFDPSDNTISYSFNVGGDTFGNEDNFTRSVAVANGVYDAGAPLSYGYGNIFRIVHDVEVDRIIWGVNNPADMTDKTVNIYLLQWTDTNGDQIAQSSERKFVGFAEYTFTGAEGDNAILEAVLDNFDNPGDPIIMKGGFTYMALVEYVATDAADPQFFMLASEDRNFNATTLASDSAFVQGISNYRIYMTVLAFSPDGIIANIDYEVRELDPNDARIHFSDDIVPLVRIVTKTTNTNEQLPLDNAISLYPNPATDDVQVKLDFKKPYSDVRLRLIDNLGRTALTKVINQTITQHVEKINVSQLTPGNYMLQVETVDGQRSIPVVVVK